MVWGQAPPSPGLVPQWAGLYDSKLSRPRDDWILRGSPRAAILVLRRGRLESPKIKVSAGLVGPVENPGPGLPSQRKRPTASSFHNGTQSHGQKSLQAAVRACVRAQPLQSCLTVCDHMDSL